jgi:hypothetical protein
MLFFFSYLTEYQVNSNDESVNEKTHAVGGKNIEKAKHKIQCFTAGTWDLELCKTILSAG